MKFINKGDPIKIRIGESSECYWKTIKTGETIDLSQAHGLRLGLTKLETTKGQINNKIVETKQIESPDKFLKELQSINGIGKKTAEDIVSWGTKEKLCEYIEKAKKLPFRDDIETRLIARYLK